uniref:Ig-like domain-containing protein n=1 Tax=Pontiella sp. TaxID=2837462 RepID=UPI003566F8DA
MKRKVMAGLAALCTVCSAGAAVVSIDFSVDGGNGPTPYMLPGVVGKTTTNVTWNMIGTTNQVVGLRDEDGLGTGAFFQFGTNANVSFAGTTASEDDMAFFRTYAHLSGGGTTAFTNDFTIGGIEDTTADLVFYATWDWADAGSEFRVSGDGGTTWSDWTLCEGVPSVENAAFSNGASYVEINGVSVTDGTILGEWCTTTNGASKNHRGPFNAMQIVAAGYADALAPVFSSSTFSMSAATIGEAYEGDLGDALVSKGSQYSFTKLSGNSWLTVAADGTLGGIPTEADAGENTFTIQVEDDLGNTDTATMTMYVSAVVNAYVDTFDGDGIDVNTGQGGGLEQISPSASYALTVTDDGVTSSHLTFARGTSNNAGAERSGVATLQKFSVVNGFDLVVVYNIETVAEPAVLSDSAGFGLVETNSVTAFDGLFVLSNKSTADSLGISLTERAFQGVTQTTYSNGVSTCVSLNNDQVSVAGTNLTAYLSVEADGTFSYSLGGTSWSTGTTTFDLTKEYHFAAWVQRFSTGFEIQSVSMVPKSLVNSVGSISLSLDGSAAGFSWYGQTGGNYELQFREDLTLEGMIEMSVAFMTKELKFSEEQARQMSNQVI